MKRKQRLQTRSKKQPFLLGENMQVGDVVTIYIHPKTCQTVEGTARLLKLLADGEELQFWRVEFMTKERKGEQANRWIKKET